MRVLIAPDKFKGTLTARQAATAIARGWGQARPQDELKLLPISDGGDGFGLVLGELRGAKEQDVRTVNAAHQPCRARWWWQARTRTAIIESANVIGLAMLPRGRFHPFQLDTFGLGAVILAACERGARRIILGIGGSATNDGGFGLARALGWRFFDRVGVEITGWPELDRLAAVTGPRRRLPGNLTVAVDVQNPLLGMRGATRVYGPQKGIRPEDVRRAERALRQLARVMRLQRHRNFAVEPGAGAAGGLGFGLAAFARARLTSGFVLLARQAGLSRLLAKTDLLITAEGALDRSTLMGKGAGQIAALARRRRISVVGLAGSVAAEPGLRRRFTQMRALTELVPAEQARSRAAFWLERLATRVARECVAPKAGKQVGKSGGRR